MYIKTFFKLIFIKITLYELVHRITETNITKQATVLFIFNWYLVCICMIYKKTDLQTKYISQNNSNMKNM